MRAICALFQLVIFLFFLGEIELRSRSQLRHNHSDVASAVDSLWSCRAFGADLKFVDHVEIIESLEQIAQIDVELSLRRVVKAASESASDHDASSVCPEF